MAVAISYISPEMVCGPAPMAIDEPSIPAELDESANTLTDACQEVLPYVRASFGQTQDSSPLSSPPIHRQSSCSSSDRLSDYGGALSSDCSAEEAANADLALSSPLTLAAVVDAAARTRSAISRDELDARVEFLLDYEASQRLEISRAERTARDELRRARALYFRSALVTTARRGFGPAVWPRHRSLPVATSYPPRPYAPAAPCTLRSCLRRRSATEPSFPARAVECGLSMGESCVEGARLSGGRMQMDLDDEASTLPTSSAPTSATSSISGPRTGRRCSSGSCGARRVVITDEVAVQAGPEVVETDGELASAAWRCISFYAPVRHMVMTSLKARYGADAADDDGWMSTVERFAWLDDMFCSVKDAYQLVHNEEAAAFAGIMDEFRAMPANAWWSRLGAMWL